MHEEDEKKLFVAKCYAANSNKQYWLIDGGYTNHMIYETSYFKDLDNSYTSKVKIGNEEYIDVKGKGVM